MTRWATATMDRTQILMFSPTLDSVVPDDHPVRLFDEILSAMDWASWENYYIGFGQPAIHPRVVASVLLYGLSQGIRSSRRLEWACGNAVDFMWLANGRRIDHSTFCGFRTDFEEPLKELFRQVGRVAMSMGMIRLNQVALDGTKVKAQSSRHHTATAQTLEERLAELDKQVQEMLTQAKAADRQEDDLFGCSHSQEHLPRELADLKRRQERLREALTKARLKPAPKESEKAPKVPVADPGATIAPNKEGGFAPNYTPVATVDAQSGMIVAADVLEDSDESEAVLPAVDQVKENFGEHPKEALADSAFNSGGNLEGLEDRNIEGYIPSSGRRDTADNPARREALDQPVPREQWDKLPIGPGAKLLGRTAFVYDEANDCYFCPMGKKLPYVGDCRRHRRKEEIDCRRYRCGDCGDCPLRGRCLTKGVATRAIDRDRHEPLREQMDVRLRSEDAKERRGVRSHLAESVFGIIKQALGVRQFLLRGLRKVRVEWTWTALTFNLRKLAGKVAKWREAMKTDQWRQAIGVTQCGQATQAAQRGQAIEVRPA
jgi:transposase